MLREGLDCPALVSDANKRVDGIIYTGVLKSQQSSSYQPQCYTKMSFEMERVEDVSPWIG